MEHCTLAMINRARHPSSVGILQHATLNSVPDSSISMMNPPSPPPECLTRRVCDRALMLDKSTAEVEFTSRFYGYSSRERGVNTQARV